LNRLLASLSLMVLLAPAAAAEDAGHPTALVELFTSQGCSACPQADRILGKLADDPSVIALTFPVDYWDYLGWKDTLGSGAHSARQRAYAMVRGDRKVYTPQVVVSGIASAPGNEEHKVNDTIESARAYPEAFSVKVGMEQEGDRLEIEATPGSGELSPGEVWLFSTAKRRSVHIDRGENGGNDLTYANVVRKMTRLGPWDGKHCKFAVSLEDALGTESDGLVVVVQAGSGGMPGAVLGAAQLHR
jgi:hypothetical protein